CEKKSASGRGVDFAKVHRIGEAGLERAGARSGFVGPPRALEGLDGDGLTLLRELAIRKFSLVLSRELECARRIDREELARLSQEGRLRSWIRRQFRRCRRRC